MNKVGMIDLPDEIIYLILNKLNMIDVFYSLMDINRRFHRLVIDPLYIRRLNLTTNIDNNASCDQISPIDTRAVSRICQRILPRIRHQVEQLLVEQNSIEEVFAVSYPRLDSLSLINFEVEILHQYLTGIVLGSISIVISRIRLIYNSDFLFADNLVLRDLAEQVTHLNIDIKEDPHSCADILTNIFGLIMSLCRRLTVLNYCYVFPTRECFTPLFLRSQGELFSSLTKLKINVEHYFDCLFILDGRFQCLSTLILQMRQIFPAPIDISKEVSVFPVLCIRKN